MSYCLNPNCPKPTNPEKAKFCITCGSQLLLENRYQALKLIGQGGFGRTFLAEDAHRLNAYCVVKQFFPAAEIQNNSQAMTKATQLFEQEARQLLKLGEQHPQIPTLYGYFEQDKRLYLVQQFIDGQDLSQELAEKGSLSEQQIRQLLHDLLPVLQFVHQQGVIHRDIKPTNILRRRIDGKLVLIDFGIAKELTVGTGLTQSGTKAGTEGYAPIEQLRGGKAYPASDLFSLGVTCIHLLTQVEPDQLYYPLEGKWMWREHLRQKGKNVSAQLGQVLDKLLKDSVQERYQSANEVLQDLKAATPLQAQPQNGRLVSTLTSHSWSVPSWSGSLAISPDGQILASGSEDNTIKLWHLETGQEIRTLKEHYRGVYSVAISADGQILASGSGDNTIKLWHLATGQKIRTVSGHSSTVYSVAISPDGQILASGSGDNTIKLWYLATGQKIRTLTGHYRGVRSVAISREGQILASGSYDNTIKLWHLATGGQIRTLKGHDNAVCSIAISPDGKFLASGSYDNTIKLWHLATGGQICTLKGHDKGVCSVAISPDGQTLASGSYDKTIKLWHLETGEEIHTLTGHSDSVRFVVFSADGQILASRDDYSIKIWRCD